MYRQAACITKYSVLSCTRYRPDAAGKWLAGPQNTASVLAGPLPHTRWSAWISPAVARGKRVRTRLLQRIPISQVGAALVNQGFLLAHLRDESKSPACARSALVRYVYSSRRKPHALCREIEIRVGNTSPVPSLILCSLLMNDGHCARQFSLVLSSIASQMLHTLYRDAESVSPGPSKPWTFPKADGPALSLDATGGPDTNQGVQ